MTASEAFPPPQHLDRGIRPATRASQLEMGKAMRKQSPRKSLATRNVANRDPVAHLEEQNATRLEHLIPLRFGRMLESPFSFYRGTAGLMALDLGNDPPLAHPRTGVRRRACQQLRLLCLSRTDTRLRPQRLR